ncbi:hypothetical protein AAL_02114 [Moelleriella libera RCEF 2490]|uniref:Uncharacterized protein n=1 Tax=Moelleriella libera RCEF 2490 TaxID=1081109 RepID=A0A162IWU0_9HYPO|nr:hypothetical protein AAL_02114 [Moelleriella libera RCEF 2490]
MFYKCLTFCLAGLVAGRPESEPRSVTRHKIPGWEYDEPIKLGLVKVVAASSTVGIHDDYERTQRDAVLSLTSLGLAPHHSSGTCLLDALEHDLGITMDNSKEGVPHTVADLHHLLRQQMDDALTRVKETTYWNKITLLIDKHQPQNSHVFPFLITDEHIKRVQALFRGHDYYAAVVPMGEFYAGTYYKNTKFY